MLKYCLNQWDKNKDKLREILSRNTELNDCGYMTLVKLTFNTIFNTDNEDGTELEIQNITEINNGDYQGTLLYLIPFSTYQPNEYEYLMTYVNYGSCSGCDTLQGIQSDGDWEDYGDNKVPTVKQLEDYMTLCRNLISNTIKPYNGGWREDKDFITVECE